MSDDTSAHTHTHTVSFRLGLDPSLGSAPYTVSSAPYPLSLGQLLLQPLVALLSDLHHRRAAKPRQAVTQSAALLAILRRRDAAIGRRRLQAGHAVNNNSVCLLSIRALFVFSFFTCRCGCGVAQSRLAAWGAGPHAGRWGGQRGAVLRSGCGTGRWAGRCDEPGGAAPLGSARRHRDVQNPTDVRGVLTGEGLSYLEVRCGGRRQVHFLEALQAFGVALTAAAGHSG